MMKFDDIRQLYRVIQIMDAVEVLRVVKMRDNKVTIWRSSSGEIISMPHSSVDPAYASATAFYTRGRLVASPHEVQTLKNPLILGVFHAYDGN